MANNYSGLYQVESIESDFFLNNVKYYIVKWLNFDAKYNSPEPADAIMDSYPAMVDQYETQKLIRVMQELQMESNNGGSSVSMMLDFD